MPSTIYNWKMHFFWLEPKLVQYKDAAAVRHSLLVQPHPSLKLVTILLPYQWPNDFCLALSCCLACLIHTPHLYCLQDTLNTANPHQLLILLYHHLPTYASLNFLICEFKSVGCMSVSASWLLFNCACESQHILQQKRKYMMKLAFFFLFRSYRLFFYGLNFLK